MTSFTKGNLTFELVNDIWTIIYDDYIYINTCGKSKEQNALMNALKDEKVKYEINERRENIYNDTCPPDYFKIFYSLFDVIKYEAMSTFHFWELTDKGKLNKTLLDINEKLTEAKQLIDELELKKIETLKQLEKFNESA